MSQTQNQEPMAMTVCLRVHLEKPALALLNPEQTAVEFVQLLAEEGHYTCSLGVLGQMFEPREAVWWACVCARQSPPEVSSPEWNRGVESAERWVAEMSEDTRRAAGTIGADLGYGNAAGCVAMAAFYSGGSLAPPGAPPAEPAPEVCGKLAAGSVLASALSPNPADAPVRFRRFIDQGIELYRNRSNS
jgi:hypothetical protein